MLCPKCGQYNPEGVACPCGAPLLSSNPAVNVLKTLGSSGRFLTIAILATAIPLCAILAAFRHEQHAGPAPLRPVGALRHGHGHLLPAGGDDPGHGGHERRVGLGAQHPWRPWACGLFYASCRNRKTGNVSTAGLTILKVLAYISAIYVGICALFLVVCAIIVPFLVLSGAEVTYNGSPVEGSGAGVIVALVIFVFAVAAVVVGLTLAYFISAIRTINRLKAIATTGGA